MGTRSRKLTEGRQTGAGAAACCVMHVYRCFRSTQPRACHETRADYGERGADGGPTHAMARPRAARPPPLGAPFATTKNQRRTGARRRGPKRPTPASTRAPRRPRAAAGRRVACLTMQLRTLGRTGVKVSPLCLGAMMFGAWGNPDHDESHRDHPPRARRRHQLHRHRRRLLARRVRGDRRQGAGRRPARRRRARHQGPRHDGRRPQPARQLAPLDHRARSRTACAASAPTGSTSTRSTGPSPTPTSTRRSAR